MTLYSYIVRYDDGFAPNPFHGVCTLACCKRVMRRVAQRGDYVVGLGSRSLDNRLVYAMRISVTITFDEYWRGRRFRAKRPNMVAGGETTLGDNIYRWDAVEGDWHQEWSHHSNDDGTQDWWFTRDDTGTDKVLVGEDFIYWGGDGPPLPDNLTDLIVGRGHRRNFRPEVVEAFVKWFNSRRSRGFVGMPTNNLPAPAGAQRGRRKC